MTPELRELYQTMIVDHGKQPRNHHTMSDASHSLEGHNPLCGDELTLFLKIADGIIEDISFEGSGCAISMASASLLTEALKGKSIKEAETLFVAFHHRLTDEQSNSPDTTLGKLDILAGVKSFPMRVKCATLAWHTLKACLDGKHQPIKTE